MIKTNIIKSVLPYIIRVTGIVFWFNILNIIFYKDFTVTRVVIILLCLLLGYISNNIKKHG